DRKADARPRHDLALESVAVDVDDARQHQRASGVERARRAGLVAERRDASAGLVGEMKAGRFQPAPGQHPAALDAHVHSFNLSISPNFQGGSAKRNPAPVTPSGYDFGQPALRALKRFPSVESL